MLKAKHGIQMYSGGVRLDVNLCTSILEVSVRLMSWLVRFRISFMRRFSSTVRAERELSLWLIQWSAHLQKRWGHPGHFWDLKKCSSEFLDVCKTCLISESVQIEVGHLHDSGKAPKYTIFMQCVPFSFSILLNHQNHHHSTRSKEANMFVNAVWNFKHIETLNFLRALQGSARQLLVPMCFEGITLGRHHEGALAASRIRWSKWHCQPKQNNQAQGETVTHLSVKTGVQKTITVTTEVWSTMFQHRRSPLSHETPYGS